MEAPAEWEVRHSEVFVRERAAITGGRLDGIVAAWEWALTRAPFRVSAGLTAADDETRVISDADPSTGTEYVAGVHIDRDTQTVELAWILTRSGDGDEE